MLGSCREGSHARSAHGRRGELESVEGVAARRRRGLTDVDGEAVPRAAKAWTAPPAAVLESVTKVVACHRG